MKHAFKVGFTPTERKKLPNLWNLPLEYPQKDSWQKFSDLVNGGT